MVYFTETVSTSETLMVLERVLHIEELRASADMGNEFFSDWYYSKVFIVHSHFFSPGKTMELSGNEKKEQGNDGNARGFFELRKKS